MGAKAKKSVRSAKLVLEREEALRREEEEGIFLRQERPFGVEQYYVNRVWVATAHIFAVYATYMNFTGIIPFNTSALFEIFYGYLGGLGVTVGCHRFWTHRTFKANLPLQIILMCMQTIANQYSIYKWTLDHRIHHKYTDTDADPHNSSRGFWFSHMTWLFQPQHPEVKQKMRTFKMPDLENDPVVRFQSKYYWWLTLFFNLVLPVSLMYYFWEMPLLYCIGANFRRYIFSLHFTWSVNSVAHIWGDRPYDKNISSVESKIVSFFALGEGWHNFHHTFPWDYKTSEFGWKLNLSTIIIDFLARIGWISDMKTVSPKLVKDRLRRTGDGSHPDAIPDDDEEEEDIDYKTFLDKTHELLDTTKHKPVWGWDDDKLPEELKKITKIIKPEVIEKKIL